MPLMNVLCCELEDDDLLIWKNPQISGEEFHAMKGRYDSIHFMNWQGDQIAIPRCGGWGRILDKLGFEEIGVNVEDYIGPFSELCVCGFVSLLMDEGFKPIRERQNMVKTNRASALYDVNSPIFEYRELKMYEGIRVRRQYWDTPGYPPFGGVSLKYTTTTYFTEPLDKVLGGIDMLGLWVQMNCPHNCENIECPFYSETRIIGRLKGFSKSGETCPSATDYSVFVDLYDRREGIDKNPPAHRVSMETSFPQIQQWAEKKYGDVTIRDEMDKVRGLRYEGRANPQKVRYEYESIMKFIKGLPSRFQLPNGQWARLEKNMLEVVVLG